MAHVQNHRNARVEITKASDGYPSIKIEGVEMSFLIGQDIKLHMVDDHWELAVTFIDPIVSMDATDPKPSKMAANVNAAAAKGSKRGKR